MWTERIDAAFLQVFEASDRNQIDKIYNRYDAAQSFRNYSYLEAATVKNELKLLQSI